MAAGPSSVRQVAVLPFKASTDLIGASASDIFSTALLQTGRYGLVERSQISGVLGETELAMAGMSDSAAIAAGRMLGADGVVLGTVDEYGTIAYNGKTYPVVGASVRMIDCTSGKVMWSVGLSSRSSNRLDTLSGHARRVAGEMVDALRQQWYKQPQRGGSASRSPEASRNRLSAAAPLAPARPTPPPPAPEFSVSDMGLREVVLQWPVPPGDYRIRVERALKAEGPFAALETVSGSKGRWVDRKELGDGVTVYYRLVTVDALGQESPPTPVKESMTAPPPNAPSALQAEVAGPRAVRLCWKASGSEGVTAYEVERRRGEGEWVKAGRISGLEFKEGGTAASPLGDEEAWAYRVRAVNRVGAIGTFSPEVGVTTLPPPSTPEGLTAASDELRCVPLVWNASEDPFVEGVEVWRRALDDEGDGEKLAWVQGKENLRYLDGGGNPGKLGDDQGFAYRLVARNGVGSRSEPGEWVEARTRMKPPMVLGVDAESGLPRRVKVSWLASEDEAVNAYRIERAEGDGDFAELVMVEGRGTESFVDVGTETSSFFGGTKQHPLTDGARYRYRVVAVNPAGAVSEMAAEAEAVTKEVPVAPKAPRVVSNLPGKIRVEWAAPESEDVSGYILEGSDSNGAWKERARGPERSFTEEELPPNTSRRYRLRVVDLDGLEGDASEVVAGRSKALPGCPEQITVTWVEERVCLKWQAPKQEDITGYRVWEKKMLGKTEWAMVEEAELWMKGEEVGKRKRFQVQSMDADGLESELSEVVEVRRPL